MRDPVVTLLVFALVPGCGGGPTLAGLAEQARSRAGEAPTAWTREVVTTRTSAAGDACEMTGRAQVDGDTFRVETWEPGRRFREGHVLHGDGRELRLWTIFDESVHERGGVAPPPLWPERWFDGPAGDETRSRLAPEQEEVDGVPCHVVEVAAAEPFDVGTATQPLFVDSWRPWIEVETLPLVRAEGAGVAAAGAAETRQVGFAGFDLDARGAPRAITVQRGDGSVVESRVDSQVGGAWDRPQLVPRDGNRTYLQLMAQEIDHDKIGELIEGNTTDDFGSGPARDAVFHPDRVMAALGLTGGEQVADIGAGEGYFTFHLARAIGPGGTVWAAEVNPAALDQLRHHESDRERNPHRNVELHLSRFESLDLPPGSIDLAFMCNLTFPRFEALIQENRDMLASIHAALRPGGRFAVIEKIPQRDDTVRLLFTGQALIPLASVAPTPENQGPARDSGIVAVNFEQAGFRMVERIAIVEGHDFVIFERR